MVGVTGSTKIVDRDLATQSVTSTAARILRQTGTGTAPATGSTYVAFTTAYGTPPIVTMVPIGAIRVSAGSVRWDVMRTRPGSFVWQGSPAHRWRWDALGFL